MHGLCKILKLFVCRLNFTAFPLAVFWKFANQGFDVGVRAPNAVILALRRHGRSAFSPFTVLPKYDFQSFGKIPAFAGRFKSAGRLPLFKVIEMGCFNVKIVFEFRIFATVWGSIDLRPRMGL